MSRVVVGYPFDPASLAEEGEINPFPESPGFDPSGAWNLTYRLVGARGFKTENTSVGWIRLKRTANSGDRFRFGIESHLVLQEAMVNRITVEADCKAGFPSSALSWSHVSEHQDTEGTILPKLGLRQKGSFQNGRLEIQIEDHRVHPQLRAPWTTEFLLFETLQRIPPGTKEPIRFDLLEDFSLVKRDHWIYPRGPGEFDLGEAGRLRLHRYDHIGSGIVPFEYYLDDQQRLLVAISGNKFLVLDDHERATQIVEAFRQRQVGTHAFRLRNPAE